MMTGRLTVNVLSVATRMLESVTLGPLSCLKLKQQVLYTLVNTTDDEVMCFFLRETTDD
jgi:hypothetical protein